MTLMQTKIALKNVGNPKAVTMLPDGTNELHLGAIVGVATGIKNGKQADGVTPFVGLVGNFEAVPSDTSKEAVASGVCYLPDAFQQPIIDALADKVNDKGEVTQPGATSVQFAYEVYAIKAQNPQGYSWQLRSAIEPSANDPLAEAKAKLVAARATQPQIAAPKAK